MEFLDIAIAQCSVCFPPSLMHSILNYTYQSCNCCIASYEVLTMTPYDLTHLQPRLALLQSDVRSIVFSG